MEYYDIIAKSYDELYGEEQLRKWEETKNLIPIRGLVLDAGCGTGTITNRIKGCVGVDKSIKLLKKGVCGDLEKLPFKNHVFDTIISLTVLQDVNNPEKAIRELKRVLKKDGHLLITVLDKERIKNIRMVIKKVFKNVKEEKITKDVVFFT